MSQPNLNEDLNIVANSNLTIAYLDGNLDIIQQLDDEPNDVGGLTSAELKAKFDEAGNVIKTYINDTLIPAILAEDATEEARASAEAARETAEQARATAEEERAAAEAARVEAENGRVSAESARVTAEQERVSAEQARADENTGIVAQATAQADAAEAAKKSAESAATSALSYKSAAYSSAVLAGQERGAAEQAKINAEAAHGKAEAAKDAAIASETAAKASETAAAASAKAAAESAARAEEVVGGGFATTTELSAHTGNTDIHVTAAEKAAWNAKADAPFKPAGKSYLTFSSPNSFTLAVNDATKHWDGTLEYFASDKTWTVWDGTTTLSAVDNDGEYVLYLRGTGNTVITGNNQNYKWVLTGSGIKCIGNIENLLDYATVESGAHPTMIEYCYSFMFFGCTSLTKAPALPATTLAPYCYNNMFNGCTSLTQAPALPATTLANDCYHYMFQGCTSLTQAPALPATTLADNCYRYMFQGCTSLTQAPALPATTLATHCYYNMFKGCTSLTQAPDLPATTLETNCYRSMFEGCTSLTQAPALPATALVSNCYQNMFYGCISLTQAPALPATTLANYCYNYMFNGCTSLTKVPALPATKLADNCYRYMFRSCTSIKLSSTQTGEYTQEYRIPSSGTGTTATNALTNMFASTGGTFKGTPEINTTYYLSSDNMVVRETEIATLNGYVGSMIDAAGPKTATVTLAAASWDSTAKTQTVTVTGVSATETAQLITPVPALASQAAYYDAGIKCTGQAANSLTFTADTVPAADLTVYVTIQEVSA